MKLILAVVQSQDVEACCDALTAGGFACTRVESAGAFLDSHNATLLTGVDDHRVDEVLDALRLHARRRVAMLGAATVPVGGPLPVPLPSSVEVEVGGAAVFILPLERFEKI